MIIACIVFAVLGLLCFVLAFADDGNPIFTGLGIFGILAAGGFLIAAFERDEAREREAFMRECVMYRKQYECTAMWRYSQDRTTVVPVVVPVR